MWPLWQLAVQYPDDAGVVATGGDSVMLVAVVNGSLQRVGSAAVVSSGAEDPLRRHTSRLETQTGKFRDAALERGTASAHTVEGNYISKTRWQHTVMGASPERIPATQLSAC